MAMVVCRKPVSFEPAEPSVHDEHIGVGVGVALFVCTDGYGWVWVGMAGYGWA